MSGGYKTVIKYTGVFKMGIEENTEREQLLNRYLNGKWKIDINEYWDFRDELNNADTTARLMAGNIEENIALYLMSNRKYDLFEPFWFYEYANTLRVYFKRTELLYAMQIILHAQNQKGYEFVEEVQEMQSVWGSFKLPEQG